MTTIFTYSQFTDVANKFIEYFKELKELKESGIDLTKLAAHSMLYKIAIEPLFEKLGVECGVEILKYAEQPLNSLEEFYSYLNSKYKFAVTERPDIKELYETPEEKKERQDVEQGKIPSFDPMTYKKKKKEKTEKTEKRKEIEEFYVNGRKVSREYYETLLRIGLEFLNNLDCENERLFRRY